MNELKNSKRTKTSLQKREIGKQFHKLKNLAISISLESSELLEIFQWQNEKQLFGKIKK